MNHTDFFKIIKSGQIGSLYLMEGVEEYIKQQALDLIKKQILPQGLEALNETVLENPPVSALRAAAETLPFMAEKRLVQVKECSLLRPSKKSEENEEEAGDDDQTKAFCEYLANLPPTTCVIFYEKGKADARRKLYGAIKKSGAIATFDALDNEELNRWIIQTMRGLGKEISPAAAATLSFTVGRDAALLKGEMEKLAAHAGDRNQVTSEDIQAIATRSLEASVFEMVDALVEGRTSKAFSLFENMLRTGGSRFAILAMILRQYRILFHYKTLRESNISPMDIKSRLGIPPFAVDRAAKQASAYSLQQLKEVMTLCVDTEFSVKSGRMAEEGSVERVMLVLAQVKDRESKRNDFAQTK